MAESNGAAKKLTYDDADGDDSGNCSGNISNLIDLSQTSMDTMLSSTLLNSVDLDEFKEFILERISNNSIDSNSELPSPSSADANTSDDNTEASEPKKPQLLFHLLSDAVFARIADYLDYWTLFRFCLLDDRFCRIIGEYIVARDGLDMGRICDQVDVRHILRYLGEYATKLYISASDIKIKDPNVSFSTEMFRHIGRFCTNLKTLYVTLYSHPIQFKMTNWSGYKNIETLTVKVHREQSLSSWHDMKGHIDCVLTQIIPKCENLKSLTIINISTSFEYLLFPSCPQGLKTLRLRNCFLRSKTNWLRFINQHKSSLQELDIYFTGIADYDFNDMLRDAVQKMPKLTSVCAYPNVLYSGLEKAKPIPDSTFLLEFINLDSIGFELTKKNLYILEMVAYRNKIQTLTIKYWGNGPNLYKDTLQRLTYFTSLKCIRFVGDFWDKCLTVRQILNALPSLVECHFCDVYSFDFKVLKMIRSPLLERIVIEDVDKMTIFKSSFDYLNEQRSFICPDAPKLQIHVDTYIFNKAQAKLGKLNGSHVRFCLKERFESYK